MIDRGHEAERRQAREITRGVTKAIVATKTGKDQELNQYLAEQ